MKHSIVNITFTQIFCIVTQRWRIFILLAVVLIALISHIVYERLSISDDSVQISIKEVEPNIFYAQVKSKRPHIVNLKILGNRVNIFSTKSSLSLPAILSESVFFVHFDDTGIVISEQKKNMLDTDLEKKYSYIFRDKPHGSHWRLSPRDNNMKNELTHIGYNSGIVLIYDGYDSAILFDVLATDKASVK